MNKTMLSLSLAGACALSACNANPFAAVVPSRGQVRLNVPGAATEGSQALLAGANSDLHASTLNIANTVNGGVGFVFRLVDEITAQPPTETDNETFAVWGPSEPRGLERNSFRFTVNKVDDSFSYKLEARAKDQTAEEDFVIAFEGVAFPGADDKGHGSLDVHWGALRSLDDTQCLIGDLHVDYAADEEPRRLDVSFVEVADGCRDETPTNATYQYLEAADASGQLDFAFRANLHKLEEQKPEQEIFAVRSRWLGDGRGRADVRLSEGEIAADLALNIPGTAATSADIVECWDANFAVVFVDTNPDELEPHLGHAQEGDVALCAFADASFAEL